MSLSSLVSAGRSFARPLFWGRMKVVIVLVRLGLGLRGYLVCYKPVAVVAECAGPRILHRRFIYGKAKDCWPRVWIHWRLLVGCLGQFRYWGLFQDRERGVAIWR
jgi:hypothetical protein